MKSRNRRGSWLSGGGRGTGRSPLRRRRLRLESLEDRRMLSLGDLLATVDLDAQSVAADANLAVVGRMSHADVRVYDATTGDFLNAADQLDPSCAPAGGPEVPALMIAPAAGHYLFETDGSAADTVLYVLDDSCSGAELACDDDTGDQDAQVVVELAAGQAAVVVVELRAGSPPGDYQLRVEGPL